MSKYAFKLQGVTIQVTILSVTIRGFTTDVSKWGVTIEVVTTQVATIQNIAIECQNS